MSMIEAECTRCSEVFVPHGVAPEDLIHGENSKGNECGGIGVIQGFWYPEGSDMTDDEFTVISKGIEMMEKHGQDMPNCDDPDCEFHHPEVREYA